MFAEDRQAAGSRRARRADESGVALITALLVVMLISGLMAGMFAAVIADQRSGSLDRDQTQVYAAAHAGLEKLTADLAALFVQDISPEDTQLEALYDSDRLPTVPGFEYTEPGESTGSGYFVTWDDEDADGRPDEVPNSTITAGAYAGFTGFLTKYSITVTARSRSGSEVRLRRGLQTVAVPVFQFGVFSEDDLTFYGGDAFDFGGRVHTNGNLWLSESAAAGATLTFSDRITAYGDVNRRYLSNGLEANLHGMSGPVRILTQIGNAASAMTFQYSPNWSSVTNAAGGFWNTANPPVWQTNGALPNSLGPPSWTTVSQSYNGNISNRLTGATVLRLPLTSQGATSVDLIKRPLVNSDEDTVNGPVYFQRYFGKNETSLRILLSDRLSDIEDLPTVTDGAVLLDGAWAPGNAAHPPIARSIGPLAVTSINAAPTGASGVMTINVTSVPLQFRVTPVAGTPNINVGGQMVACTGKTQNTFFGCTALTAIKAANTVVTSVQPSGATASTTTAGALNIIGATTITVATNGTAGFAPIHFWLNGVTSVSCQGFQEAGAVHRYTNCAWWGTASATGTAPANGQAITSQATAALNEELVGGFIKIERSNGASPPVWTDVTTEILNLGIAAPNQEGVICQDPTPDAVLRIQRLRDNGGTPNTGVPATPCPAGYANSTNAYDYWPNALYDAREGNYRPGIAVTSPAYVGGVMNYIALDVNNLRRWLAGTIPAVGSTGPQAVNSNNDGYIVYFSDRRGDHTDAGTFPETGEYGSEDFVNTGLTGLPVNGTLQTGENANGVNGLDTYGQTPHPLGVQQADFTGYGVPFNGASFPWTIIAANQAQSPRMNRQVLFRKALKLVNAGVVAGASRLPADGLTVVAENPVYVQGNYNATNDPVANPNEAHAPAAIIADAVSILSNNWTDARSFRFPNDAASRPATTTGYRFAVVTGKGLSFSNAGLALAPAAAFLFGTDGGAGNFLRMMENWRPAGVDLNYRGSMVSLFISRQATGTFKYGAPHNVYDYADRNFRFDSEFLQPDLLPPGTPRFTDVNMLTFRQILRPNQD